MQDQKDNNKEQKMLYSGLDTLVGLIRSLLKPVITEAIQEHIQKQNEAPTAPTSVEERLYTYKEAAEFMSCSPSTIRNRMKSEQLKYYKWGQRIYFKKDDLLASAKPSNDLS